MRILLVAAALMLAGCTAADDAVVDDDDAGALPAPVQEDPIQGSGDFGWLVTVGVPEGGPSAGISSSNAAGIEVPQGIGTMEVTAAWTCTSPTCTLSISLWSPDTQGLDLLLAEPTARAVGDGEVELVLEAPQAGEWHVVAQSEGPTAQVAGSFAWTLTP